MSAQTNSNVHGPCFYNIHNKAADGIDLFKDNEDCEKFLDFLKEYLSSPLPAEHKKKMFSVNGRNFLGVPHQPKNYFGKIDLLVYSLMPNDFHLLVKESQAGSLEKLMRSLNTRYAIYYNKKYQRKGPIYSGSYKSSKISEADELVTLSRKLHKRHLDVPNAAQPSLSSYSYYQGGMSNPWLKTQIVLSFFEQSKKEKFGNAKTYQNYVEKNRKKMKKIVNDANTETVTPPLPTDEPQIKKVNSQKEEVLHLHHFPKSNKLTAYVAGNAILFLTLSTLGFRNVKVASFKMTNTQTEQSVATLVTPSPIPQIAGVSDENLSTYSFYSQSDSKSSDDSTSDEDTSPTSIVQIKADLQMSVNIRSKPDSDSKVIAKAANEDQFELVSSDNNWYEIELDENTTGFVSTDFASLIVKEEEK